MFIDLAVNQIVFGRFCLLWARSRDMAKILFGITGTQVGPASSFYMGAGQPDSQYLHTTNVNDLFTIVPEEGTDEPF